MRKVLPVMVVFIFAVSILSVVFLPTNAYADTDNEQACWGQATVALAKMRSDGDPDRSAMGEHASQQAEPRAGLGVLARLFYEDGIIDEPTLQALGAFLVSLDPELTVEACMD